MVRVNGIPYWRLSGFYFLDSIEHKYPTVHEDTIIISGNASDDVVNMCLASNVNYLLEKPMKPYALQLAVRAITAKYLDFAKKLFHDQSFAENVARFRCVPGSHGKPSRFACLIRALNTFRVSARPNCRRLSRC